MELKKCKICQTEPRIEKYFVGTGINTRLVMRYECPNCGSTVSECSPTEKEAAVEWNIKDWNRDLLLAVEGMHRKELPGNPLYKVSKYIPSYRRPYTDTEEKYEIKTTDQRFDRVLDYCQTHIRNVKFEDEDRNPLETYCKLTKTSHGWIFTVVTPFND